MCLSRDNSSRDNQDGGSALFQIWPVGYKLCWHDQISGSVFVCEVLEGGDDGPIFRVRRFSSSAFPIPVVSTVLSRRNPSPCNGKEKVSNICLTSNRINNGTVDGKMLIKWLQQDKFGLDVEFVQEVFEQLPLVRACSGYIFLNKIDQYSGLLSVQSGFLLSKRKNDSLEPDGISLTVKRPRRNLVGDVLQGWEFLWRFSEILGLKEPFSLEELENELIHSWVGTINPGEGADSLEGILCGSLTGVGGMEADALLLAQAQKLVFGPLKNNEIFSVGQPKPEAISTPPEWAKKILHHSISREVYKGNASGLTKRAVVSLLAEACGKGFQPKPVKRERPSSVWTISDLLMKQCHIVLRRAAAEDNKKIFCYLLEKTYDSDEEGLLGSPDMVSRPLDFRLAAGAYAGSHEAFFEMLNNIRSIYADRADIVKRVEKVSQKFKDMYEEQRTFLFKFLCDETLNTCTIRAEEESRKGKSIVSEPSPNKRRDENYIGKVSKEKNKLSFTKGKSQDPDCPHNRVEGTSKDEFPKIGAKEMIFRSEGIGVRQEGIVDVKCQICP